MIFVDWRKWFFDFLLKTVFLTLLVVYNQIKVEHKSALITGFALLLGFHVIQFALIKLVGTDIKTKKYVFLYWLLLGPAIFKLTLFFVSFFKDIELVHPLLVIPIGMILIVRIGFPKIVTR